VTDVWNQQPYAPAPGTAVCALDDIPDGGAKCFEFGRAMRPFELLVARSGSSVYGYYNRCAHMEVPLNLLPTVQTAAGHLMCDHHYARFRFADGLCVEGPCQNESLMPVPLEQRGGKVYISPRSS
jgi:nitrite reductase/ring-hydroxylating ferredoxin subunit